MNEIKELMKNLKTEDIKIYLVTRYKTKHKKDYQAFNIKLSPNLCKYFLTTYSNKIDEIIEHQDFKINDYNPIHELENGEVEKIDIIDLHQFSKIQSRVNSLPNNYELENVPKGYEPWIYVIVMNLKEEINEKSIDSQILIFRQIKNKKLIKEKFKFKMIIPGTDQEYDELKKEILVFDDQIDCICHFYQSEENNSLNEDRYMYVINKYPFELIFGFEQKFKDNIKDNIKNFKEVIDRDNEKEHLIDLDKLYELCETDQKKLKKLYYIFEEGIFDRLSQENIDFVRDDLEINITKDAEGLIEVNKDNIKPVLDIILDNYLKSPISKQNYRTRSDKEII